LTSIWSLAYHLSGITLLGVTPEEPLGPLPLPLRSAVLEAAAAIDPAALEIELREEQLFYSKGVHRWVSRWHPRGLSALEFFEALGKAEGGPKLRLRRLLVELPRRFALDQQAVLALLEGALRRDQPELTLVVREPATPSFALALLERVAELYRHPLRLPKLTLELLRPLDPAALKAVMAFYSRLVDQPRTPIDWRIADQPSRTQTDAILVEDSKTPREEGLRGLADSQARPERRPAAVERSVLDFFARRYFPLSELKSEQLVLLERALLGQSGLGILPTGFGKSLIFQLYALLTPGITLVVSPLRSLMRDQLDRIRRLGLICAGSASDFSERGGAYPRLLLLSPERIQIKSFEVRLRAMVEEGLIAGLVIDEAHCISEWGHDFRPAYLQIGRWWRSLEAASGRSIPLIALTATASKAVRNDICATLGLDASSVVQLASSDRPNLSLSVHTSKGGRAKEKLLERVLKELIPTALGLGPEELIPPSPQPIYPHAGIVFGIYANPHGKSTLSEGVHHIARVIRERVVPEAEMVQVHASTPPTLCPHCGSPFYRQEGQGSRCLECGATFSRHKEAPGWEKAILERQDAFQENRFPLLVATKGYGMGIDKRNIRFVVHYGLSSSLEGYYQEAGRAGRDGAHAHIALIYVPPSPACLDEHLHHHREPPCVSDPKNFKFRRCPYGLPGLCDYGRQATFIKMGYPGIEEDLEETLKVYDQLVAKAPLVLAGDEERDRRIELALYRLQQLGIVEQYLLDYQNPPKALCEVTLRPDWDAETLRDHLRRYLLRTEGEAYVEQTLARLAGGQGSSRRTMLELALRALLERIYTTILCARYFTLNQELSYAESHREGICRRVRLRNHFDDAGCADDYRCEFCDVCVPDLRFHRDQAKVPLSDLQIDEVLRSIPEVIRRFEPEKLAEVIEVATRRGALISMAARISSFLEEEITNVPALYLMGALTRRQKGREGEALEFLQAAFEEGLRQDLSRKDLIVIFEEAALIDPEAALRWLSLAGGPFEEDLGFLEGVALRILGPEATPARVLRALRHTRRLAHTAETIAQLKGPLASLLEGFKGLELS